MITKGRKASISAVVFMVALISGGCISPRQKGSAPPPPMKADISKPEIVANRPPIRGGLQLAVMALANKTGEPEYGQDGETLSERISIRLSGYPNVKIVERAQFNEVLDELALSERVPIDEATVARIGRLLGANYMVFGSLTKLGPLPSISLRIVSVETGEIIGGAMIDTAGRPDFDRASGASAKELMAAIQGFKTAEIPTKP